MSVDISIVIPTCNRLEKLKGCIQSILGQDFLKERMEIIVVDDRADREVENILEYFKRQHQNLRYVAQYYKGPAAARNLGARISKGRLLGFVDDDCILGSNWLKSMLSAHDQNPEVAAVGGDTLTSVNKASLLASQFLSTGSIETDVNGEKEVIFFPTCNVSIKKEIFNSYCFNENFPFPGGEDLEFFWRLFKDGHRFIWDRSIQVTHCRDDTLRSFLKQAYCYGRGNLLVQHIHGDQPLLKELKTGNFTFWAATFINIIKIPRFSYVIGKRLIRANNIKGGHKRLSIYFFFLLHKILYILGNIVEFLNVHGGRYKKNINFIRLPQLLILDITHSCNLRCQICDIWKTGTSETDLDISYVKKMLFEAKNMGIKEIALSGGEPLARSDIFEIFDYASEIGIKNIGVLTNGLLVNANLARLKPYLVDNTISLVVSFDSLKPELHNYIRNSDFVWEKARGALTELSYLKKQYPQINFNVISIILNQNIDELLDIAEFVRSLGANSLQFQPLLSNNLRMVVRKNSVFWVTQDKLPVLDKAIDKLIEFKEREPQFIKNSSNNLSLIKKYYRGVLTGEDVVCLSASKTVLVANQGVCTTCFSSFGEIKNQSLKDILEGKEIIMAGTR